MKNHFTIIHKPRHIIAISLAIAIVIGIIGYMSINRPPAYQFVKVQSGTIENIWSLGSSTNASGQNLTLSFLASGKINTVSAKVGDQVKDGQTLATLDPENTAGALTQAKAAYASAVANYNKLLNGATPADVAVSSASLETAKTALAHNKETLVQALKDSLTSGTNAVNNNTDVFFSNSESDAPQLITAGVNFSNQNLQYQVQNERVSINKMLISWKQELTGVNSDGDLTTLTSHAKNNLQSIGTYIDDLNSLFTANASVSSGSQIAIAISQGNIISARGSITGQISSLSGASQAVSNAEAGVVQSEAGLSLKTSSARPEDVAAAQAQVANAYGAVQIAQAAYQNHIITAPGDGIITAVYITVGQIATPNASAIDLSGKTFSKNVSIMIPNSAIIDRDGQSYVLVKKDDGVQEKKIVIGASDATNTEVVSGISAGDQVVTH